MKRLLLIAAFALSACTNTEDARKALESEGFTDVQNDGYGWFRCSQDDFYHTKFTALNPQGREVSGVVCSGLIFKSATIRW